MIGKLIDGLNKSLRKIFHIKDEKEADKGKKLFAGFLLVLFVLIVSVGVPGMILFFLEKVNHWVRVGLECFWCFQLLAAKSLYTESMKVFYPLKDGKVEDARYAVSMIVGRDTKDLNEEGITKAAVETVAENTSDGVIAPLLFIGVFGVLGGFFYKAVNTMDSMVGYKNDKNLYMGRFAAKLDDFVNLIPSRVAAHMMLVAAFVVGFDFKNACKIYHRDRYKHASPNSAQTESVCAGALDVQLAGDAYYFGELHKKDFIGEAKRPIEVKDIKRANVLMLLTGVFTWIYMVAIFITIK